MLVESLSEQDQLNRDALVGALAAKMLDPDNTGHFAVGLLGDWGVGKSSVIAQLRAQVQPAKTTLAFFSTLPPAAAPCPSSMNRGRNQKP